MSVPYFHFFMQKANISTVITHIGSWLLFLSLPAIFITSQSNVTSIIDVLLSPYYWMYFISFITLFYLHTYYLFPAFYRKQKKLFYFLSLALLFFLLLWLKPFDKLMNNWRQQITPKENNVQASPQQQPPPGNVFDNQPPPGFNNGGNQPPPPSFDNADNTRPPLPQNQSRPGGAGKLDIISIFMFIIIIAISISLDVSLRWQRTVQQAAKAETGKANAELSVLKAQVNPHFLFNTLNNIYSLAVTGDENTAESIMKLSNIMRYVTDDAPEDFVPLEKEIACINDFIDLQRLRIGSKVILDYTVSGNVLLHNIAPFILLTFIENVFKYGVSNKVASHITIQVEAANEGVRFLCSNPLPETKKEDRKGTGLANIKKRLAYLYPDRHTLTIFTTDNLFTVQLFITDKI